MMFSSPLFRAMRFVFGVFFLLLTTVFPAHAEITDFQESLISAYQKNPDLMAEQAKLRATDEQVSVALSGYRPTVDAVGEGGRQWGKVSGDGAYAGDSKLNPHSVGINLTQPLFSGFKTKASVDSSKASVMAQRAALQDAEQHLFLDAAKAYLDVAQAQTVLQLNRDNEHVLQQQLDMTKDRFRIGELKKTDVSQSDSRLKAAMVSRLQAEGELTNQRMTFVRLVGDLPGSLAFPKLTVETPQKSDDAVDLALRKNPSVIAAAYSHDAAKADIDAASGSLLPQVDLVGSTTRAWDQSTTIQDRQDSASAMVRVTVPLYRAGSDYAKTRAAQQTSTQKKFDLEYARQKARESALNALQSLQTATAAIAGRKEVVTATEDALEGVREESKVGTRTTLDVLNAEEELLNAKINYARAEHDEAIARLQLKAAVGELTADALHLDVSLYDPQKNYDAARNSWAGFAPTEEH